jgi:ElaB/YqjD/DUF883 family membrane-anchored ribosome-binding protein
MNIARARERPTVLGVSHSSHFIQETIMAETADLAPTRRAANGAARRSASSRSRSRAPKNDHLEDQVERLQDDLKAITRTLARLSEEKVTEARDTATSEAQRLINAGREMVSDVGDQANALERQLKTMIRDKPLTAIGAAIGAGFILALMARM